MGLSSLIFRVKSHHSTHAITIEIHPFHLIRSLEPTLLCYARGYHPSIMETQATTQTPPYTENENDALKASQLNQKYQRALQEEHQEDDLALRTKETFRNSAVNAAHEITYLALHSPRDNIRLSACKYIVDRVLGPLPKEAGTAGDAFADLLVRVSSSK